MSIKSSIRTIENYPKPGVMFRDITTLLKDPKAFQSAIEALAQHYAKADVNYIAGIEARGFIIGAALAMQLGKGFIPLRKPGKLPANSIGCDYQLEYGTDRIEMHEDALSETDTVLLVDDLIATGGTANAACKLIKQAGAKIFACCFVVDLPDLGGRALLEKQGYPVFTLCEFEGD